MKAANAYDAPYPREVPKLISDAAEFTASREGMFHLANVIAAGRVVLLPTVPTLDNKHSLSAIGAQLLARLEAARLNDALATNSVYYATADTTSLAIAGAQSPITERLSPRRPPAQTGFIMFEEPIGGYADEVETTIVGEYVGPPGLKINTPIVAAAWSPWTPDAIRVDDAHPVVWYHHGFGGVNRVPSDFDGLWITFYSWGNGRWDELDPNLKLFNTDSGPIYGRDMATIHNDGVLPVLSWDTELILPWGLDLSPEPPPDSTGDWLNVLYTAWQMMAQTGKAQLTETEDEPALRSWRRRQERDGKPAPGVRVVRLHTRHRPDPKAVEDDAAESSGRRAPNYTHRWPVRPFRKSVCLNTRQHADGGCEHEERLFPASIRGPKDKPLRIGGKVHLWDTAEGGADTEGS